MLDWLCQGNLANNERMYKMSYMQNEMVPAVALSTGGCAAIQDLNFDEIDVVGGASKDSDFYVGVAVGILLVMLL